MRIHEEDVESSAARSLLGDYFAYRASAFPPGRAYLTTWPDPADYATDRGVFLVVESDDGTPIGCAGLRRLGRSGDGPDRAEIKHVWVSPDARGGGAAGALMDELESRARAWGVNELVLDTHHSLEDAARLYLRKGFALIQPYNANPNATRWYAKSL